MSMYYYGADGGVTGACVALDANGNYVDCIRLDHDDGSVFRDWLEMRRETVILAALEEAKPYRGNGVVGAFELGREYERMRVLFIANRLPLILVRSTKWQDAAGFSKPTKLSASEVDGAWLEGQALTDEARAAKLSAKAARKNRDALKAAIWKHAKMRWPTLPLRVKEDQGLADAAFIADYCRRYHLGLEVRAPRKARESA